MTDIKRCYKCGETKPIDQFNRNRTRKDGMDCRCRNCMHEYKAAAWRDPAHPHHRAMVRGSKTYNAKKIVHGSDYYWIGRENRWRKEGIIRPDGSPFLRTDYYRLFALQGEVCALCGRNPPLWTETLSVDHDKKTGVVRGLLCDECNRRAVGIFEKWGRFGHRPDVQDLIRSYLDNPPASRLPRPEAIP